MPKQVQVKEPRLRIQPEHDESTRPSECDPREDEHGGGKTLELEIEDQPNGEERNRQNDT